MNGKDMPPGHLVHHAERNAIKHAMELAVRVPAEESEPAAYATCDSLPCLLVACNKIPE